MRVRAHDLVDGYGGREVLVEPQARFDIANIATSARAKGGDWLLNGRKGFVINGVTADLLIVPGASHLFDEPGTLEQAAFAARDWLGPSPPRSCAPERRR